MLIVAAFTIYSTNPSCPQLRTTIEQLKAKGLFVVVKPLSDRKQRQKTKAVIDPDLSSSLANIILS
jgi:hypothetical protein